MWHKGSKSIACHFLGIEPEAQIGERGFEYIMQFSWCPCICYKLLSSNPISMSFVLFNTE